MVFERVIFLSVFHSLIAIFAIIAQTADSFPGGVEPFSAALLHEGETFHIEKCLPHQTIETGNVEN